MITINLLAKSGAATRRTGAPGRQRSTVVRLGLLLLAIAATGAWWASLRQDLRNIDTRIALGEAELARLKEEVGLVELAAARKATLAERLSLVERLRADRLGSVRLLETVGDSVPDDLWLTEIRQVGTRIEIDGRAMTAAAVTDFAERMQQAGVFKKPVEVLSATAETLDRVALVRFSIRAEASTP